MTQVQEQVDAALEPSPEAPATSWPRPSWARWVDPLDVAGRTARAVLPVHPPHALAHGVYYATLSGFVAFEALELPVALVLTAGHLMLSSHNRYLHELGAALEEAV